MYRFLLVEDDRNIRELIVNYFTRKEKNVFEVDIASDGQTGLEKAYENHYDLLLLDVMLPELDGFEICREIRRESDVPIMFITARADESDMLNAYALGCDDYVVKPFPSLNPNNGMVVCDDEEIKLTAREYAILKVLMENRGCVISRDQLLDMVWGYNNDTDERVLDTHMRNLRKALGDAGKQIKTIIRRGYKIEDH